MKRRKTKSKREWRRKSKSTKTGVFVTRNEEGVNMSVFSEVLQRCCILLRLHSAAERQVSVSSGGVTV